MSIEKVNAASRLRNMSGFRVVATSLDHVAVSPEVQHALLAWVERVAPNQRGVLVGGLALSFYAKPRYTQDVDVLFLHDSDVPVDVAGFKPHRKHAFEEFKTQVEIEIVTPKSINIPVEVAQRVVNTAKVYSGIKIASFEALIVLKLYGSLNPKRYLSDLADIGRMLDNADPPDLGEWHLTDELKANLQFVLDNRGVK